MPYRFIEDEATADVAFEAWGEDLNAVFRDSGNALTGVMIENPQAILPRDSRQIDLSHDQLDLLLYNFLDQLIYYKDTERLLLLVQSVQVSQQDSLWVLKATADGEPLDPTRHHQVVDVKAVTLHEFRLEKSERLWRAHVILDI
jgi:SHS2 domain-containing protein